MKHYLLRACIVLLYIFMGIMQSAAGNVIPISNSKRGPAITKEVIQSDPVSYQVRVIINYLNDSLISSGENDYHRLAINGIHAMQEVGKPELPTITQHIGLPSEDTIQVEIVENAWTDIATGKIFPAQNDLLINTKDTVFHIVEDVYDQKCYLPQLLTVGERQVWKGISNTYITICPFKYYPKENRLSVLSDFTLKVFFSKSENNKIASRKYKETDLTIFDNTNFLSPQTILPNRQLSNGVSSYPNLLIIVGNISSVANSQEMAEFRKWKALKGISTKVATCDTIGTDSASIKAYIAQEVANGVENVLFVGDQTTIPIPALVPKIMANGYPILLSDYWYGCLDGVNDTQADVPIGRFIVSTITDFRNMVKKTIDYESNRNTSTNKALLIANEQPIYQTLMEDIRTENYVNPMTFYTAYGALPENGGDGATSDDIFNYINAGLNLVAYNGHSSTSGIWIRNCPPEPDFNHDVQYNDTIYMDRDKTFVFVNTGCCNGDFTYSWSMMRCYMQSDHCTAAYVAGTYPVYTYPGNTYLTSFHHRLLNIDNYHLGSLNLLTHIETMGIHTGLASKNNAFCSVCAGDPTLELWTGEQHEFQNVHVFLQQDSIVVYVSNVDNYTINTVDNNGNFLCNYFSSNGYCKIPASEPVSSMAINKHNYQPVVIHVDTNSNYIQNETFHNGVFYYGEPIAIGYNVTTSKSFGNVVVESGVKLFVNKGNGVTIKNGFNCKTGAEFTIE